MELKQYPIHRKYKKCEAKNQITMGNDYGVPDGKPDIAEILQKRGEICIEEVHTEKGKIRIRGMLKVSVFYLAERSSEVVNSFGMEFPFEELLYMEGAVSGDNLKIDWNLEELRVTIVHPGKLSVRAIVTLHGEIVSVQTHPITESLKETVGAELKSESFVMAEPVIERRDSCRIRDEIQLPANKPNVETILWKNLQVRGLEITKGEGNVSLKGELLVSLLYKGEGDEMGIQWIEQSIPFHGNVEVSGVTFEMPGWIAAEISHQNVDIKPDYDGEMRMFAVELLLELHLHMFEEKQCSYLADSYSTKESWDLQKEELGFEKVRMCTQTKCSIEKREDISEETKILQIVGHHGELLGKNVKVVEGGILCEGTLEVQVLYVTINDRRPFGSSVVSIPYSQLIEVPQMGKEDRWNVQEGIEQLNISMADGNHLEIRGRLKFDACVLQQCSLRNVVKIESQPYNPEAFQKMPGMRIHFVQQGESLWQIAKENRTTMEEILKCNELQEEEISPGQKLLLVKAMEGPVLHLS